MSSTATIRAEAGKKGKPHPGGKDTTPDPPGQERKQEVIGGLPNMPDHARDKALVFTGPVLYYYIIDHLGTPQLVVDAEGQVMWQGDYLPFGEVTVTADEVGNSIRFPGQYFDAETGLHYNWNRYYDPSTGRYISADPIGLAGGINLYAYAGGNPVNAVDPMGLAVYYCYGRLRTYKHAAVCLDGNCAGLMPDGINWFSGRGFIKGEKRSDFKSEDCSPKDVDDDPCCDQGKYEKCIQREAIDKIGSDHDYGILTFNCVPWARGVITKCQKEACSQ